MANFPIACVINQLELKPIGAPINGIILVITAFCANFAATSLSDNFNTAFGLDSALVRQITG